MTWLQAGAGRAAIAYPPTMWPLDGFVGEHDALQARVLLVEGTTRLVWAVIDQTSLPTEPLEAIREQLATATRTPTGNVIVSVSHTFCAPHLAPYPIREPGREAASGARMGLARDAVFNAVEQAAEQAVSTLRPVSLSVATGVCDINANRDVETPAGWGLGVSPNGYSDKTLTVFSFEMADGPVAVLVNYAVQPAVLHESSARLATADLAGAALRRIEARTGAVALFLIGAAGDQAPAPGQTPPTHPDDTRTDDTQLDAAESGFALAEELGERLAAATLRAMPRGRAVPGTEISIIPGSLRVPGQQPTPRELIKPTRAHRYLPEADRDLPYWIIRLGGTAIVGTQVELSAVTGQALREAGATAVATMVNGGAKYLPEAEAFDRFTYAALSSRYAKGAAEALVATVSERLRRSKP
ncbi:MAG: hypothetical protein LBK95_06430 [Bifidobacteriaceae bacterium]|jgi:hypothetical protein|nr:hypothetical protein [Bifidobacteriaceae bacterium]